SQIENRRDCARADQRIYGSKQNLGRRAEPNVLSCQISHPRFRGIKQRRLMVLVMFTEFRVSRIKSRKSSSLQKFVNIIRMGTLVRRPDIHQMLPVGYARHAVWRYSIVTECEQHMDKYRNPQETLRPRCTHAYSTTLRHLELQPGKLRFK